LKLLGFIAIGLILSVIAIVITIALIPSTDDFDLGNPLWNGLSILTKSHNITPINAISVSSLTSGTVLVMGVDVGFTELEIKALREFTERGGYLVILEDFRSIGYSLVGALGFKVDVFNGILVDPLFYHKDYTLPRVTLGNSTGYFNYGTAIREHDGVCVGYSSSFSFIDINMNKAYDSGEPRGPLCIAVEWHLGRGMVVLITDSSIAINSMVYANEKLLEVLVSGNVYVISDKWYKGLYSTLRSNAIDMYDTLVGTRFRYILVLVLLALYPLIVRMVSVFREEVVDELDLIIRRTLNLNPSWDPEILKSIAREWYKHWRSSRS